MSSIPSMDPGLKKAAEEGDFDVLCCLIGARASLFKDIDEEPFVDIDTPLHAASVKGQIVFSEEMMNLKPFARKLNQKGFSPMHLALKNNSFVLVRRLLQMDKDLAHVKGREGVTSFLYAEKLQDQQDQVRKFLATCPECIDSETAQNKALKKHRIETFKALDRFLRLSIHKIRKPGRMMSLIGRMTKETPCYTLAARKYNQ
ncbi:hypothetical protein REPUB_Repub03eG0202600 [Reevesia pubescens]